MIAPIRTWRLVDDGFDRAALNMALDEVLFRKAASGHEARTTLRIYACAARAVTVGVTQQIKHDPVLKDFLRQHWNGTRRITGGGMVYHGEDLTYSIMSSRAAHSGFESVRASYKTIHQIVSRALSELQLPVALCVTGGHVDSNKRECFTNPVTHDIMLHDTKIAGAAQKCTRGYFLHQGSIALRPLMSENESIGTCFVRVRNLLVELFSRHFNIVFTEEKATRAEREEALVLERDKYAKDEWLFKR